MIFPCEDVTATPDPPKNGSRLFGMPRDNLADPALQRKLFSLSRSSAETTSLVSPSVAVGASMPAQRRKLLNVAMTDLLKARSAILEGAGYEVVGATNILEVQAACETHRSFDLVIIGYALPKGEKRRVMGIVRKFCGAAPILELYSPGTARVDEEADELLPSADEPETLLRKVGEVLNKKRKKRRAAL